MRRYLWNLKNALKGCVIPWTVKGSGEGSGGSGAWDNVDRWSSVPTLSSCWIGLQSTDGVQLLLKQNSSYVLAAVYKGSYVGTGADATTWPDRGAPPATEIDLWSNTGYKDLANIGGDFYQQVAVSSDGCSFYTFAKLGAYVPSGMAVIKLTSTKTGDPIPYWAFNAHYVNHNIWDRNHLQEGTYNPAFGVGIHPGGGNHFYAVPELRRSGIALFDNIGADPVSGKEQLIECLAICLDTSYKHLRGKIPGLLMCSDARAVGDTFNAGEFVCVGGKALPWGSNTIPLL